MSVARGAKDQGLSVLAACHHGESIVHAASLPTAHEPVWLESLWRSLEMQCALRRPPFVSLGEDALVR